MAQHDIEHLPFIFVERLGGLAFSQGEGKAGEAQFHLLERLGLFIETDNIRTGGLRLAAVKPQHGSKVVE